MITECNGCERKFPMPRFIRRTFLQRCGAALWVGVPWLLSTAHAADVRLAASPAQPLVGETVVVAMGLSNAPACATWSLFLRFDPAKLEFTGQWEADARTFVADSRVKGLVNSSGEVRLGGYAVADLARSGTLARVWFRAAATGNTEVATANRQASERFGNALYTLAGVATLPYSPAPAAISIGSAFSSAGDGVPDAWKIRYFGSIGAAGAGASADPDHDGMNNLAEYRAGTVPTNASSVLRMSSAECHGGGFVVTWPGVDGKTYRIEAATNLVSGFTAVEASALRGTPPMNVHTATVGQAQAGFYRVVLE
jgi:hypothetical protein